MKVKKGWYTLGGKARMKNHFFKFDGNNMLSICGQYAFGPSTSLIKRSGKDEDECCQKCLKEIERRKKTGRRL